MKHKKTRKKNPTSKYLVIGLVGALLVAAFFISQRPKTNIDYSQYNYLDEQVEKPDAAHTIEVFEDFQCPACGQFAPVLKTIKENYDVQVKFRHFPLNSIHPNAQLAAEASECARDQGRFWAYHDVLYDHQDLLSKKYLKLHAQGLGLDMQQFNDCLDNRKKQLVVAEDQREGLQRKVSGTPTVFVDGQLVKPHTVDNIVKLLQ